MVIVLLGACAAARAQDVVKGTGKVEVGGFPFRGAFYVGGDDDNEVNFNTYLAGGFVDWYAGNHVGFEGEVTGGIGLAQDIHYRRALVSHNQMPYTWSYGGNLLYYPAGAAGRRMPFYVTGGAGMLVLQARAPTVKFGFDPARNKFQSFPDGNIGAGVKIFRVGDAADWGFRLDYRVLFIGTNEDAPALFARTKSRVGHRIYLGVL